MYVTEKIDVLSRFCGIMDCSKCVLEYHTNCDFNNLADNEIEELYQKVTEYENRIFHLKE